MLVIGERINSTRRGIGEAIKSRNASFILNEAVSQIKSGAHYIDINCAVTTTDELQDIDWVINVIQSEVPDFNISIDSPNYLAIEKALNVYRAGGDILINSITGEEARIKQIVPLAKRYNTKLIALTIDENGMPESGAQRFDIARKIYDRLRREEFPVENLYIDALIRPVSTEPMQAQEFLKSLPLIKKLDKVKTICGLSNVSYGLPNRPVINATFLSMATQAGLDAAILDPTDRLVHSSIAASRVVMCRDGHCAEYIRAYREKRLI
jgi:5-methyltetrahydrofolate corrinoid/iron sulfur protein methyltransferase